MGMRREPWAGAASQGACAASQGLAPRARGKSSRIIARTPAIWRSPRHSVATFRTGGESFGA
jgi:hypothetical protein